MRHKLAGLLLIGLFSLVFPSSVPAQERSDGINHWDFDVYLNDKKVGKHTFKVTETGGVKQVRSEASFNYKIFFISAYRYEHSAAERWTDNCLTAVDASTRANGKRIQISGKQTDIGFVVESGDKPTQLPECVMTFAYWNSEFLGESQLLNPQTGKYVDVRVEEVGDEMLEVRGQAAAATRFKLTAFEVDMTLWYSPDNEWLALESVAKGGHIIRYELT
jgi:hypothetical protein